MRSHHTKQILYLVSIWIAICICLLPARANDIKTHTETVPTAVAHPDVIQQLPFKAGVNSLQLKGLIRKEETLTSLNSKLGFTAKSTGKEMLPAAVIKLGPGSPLAKRGIVSGDFLTGEVTNADGSLTLTMEHAGQAMRFTLKTTELTAAIADQSNLQAAMAKLAPLHNKIDKTSPLAASIQKRQCKNIVDALQNHDLGLIIDCSGSMHTADCPGGVTRWDWCCQQSAQLAQAAREAASSVDVSLFNGRYRTFRNITADQLPEIFAENGPSGGTEPAGAVQEQLENYFTSSRAKPLTIVIITDGLPNNGDNLARVLHDGSQKIRYQGELTITFLLISDRVDAERLRRTIGLTPDSSVLHGGFVDVVEFETLVSKGIKQSLFEDLSEIRKCTDWRKPSRASETAVGTQIFAR